MRRGLYKPNKSNKDTVNGYLDRKATIRACIFGKYRVRNVLERNESLRNKILLMAHTGSLFWSLNKLARVSKMYRPDVAHVLLIIIVNE